MSSDGGSTSPALALTDPGPAIAHDAAADGRTFDGGSFASRYVAGTQLGRGGMGEVHLLADRASGREVAMKVIRADRRDPEAQRRFAREARVQAQLEHPSIIPVYDLGRDAGGAPYFTMKRVQGRSLAEVLRDGDPAYTPRKLLTVIARVAMTLEYAHRRQVVHRDLKPANVMIGAFDEVYVLDWGLAQVRDPSEGPLPGFGQSSPALAPPQLVDREQLETDVRHTIGTPGYQAPELLRSREPVDQRCDVYALGVMLFELLAGQRPHQGQTLADVAISTLTTDGASPRERAPERDIAPELDALVVACTRLDPGQRPERARDVARAIDAFLDGDRDLIRRRELAAHAARAADEAWAARDGGGEEARARALREVTRALALDPDHAGARGTLFQLLTEPSPSAEAAADQAFRPVALRRFREASAEAGASLLVFFAFVPFLLWMGVRSWPGFAILLASMAGAVIATLAHSRWPPRNLELPPLHLAVTALALFAGCAICGPLIMMPTVALINGVGYVSIFEGKRWRIIALGVAVIVAPTALAALELIPASYRFADGAMIVRPGITWLPPVATTLFLATLNALLVALCILYVARMRRSHRRVERRIRTQAWQLAQLVPDEARAALLQRVLEEDLGGARAAAA